MTVKEFLSRAVSDGVRLLAEDEGKALIARFGVAVPSGRRVLTAGETEAAGRELGYPLVVKALVPDLAHKTDLGAVKLGIQNEASLLAAAQELNRLFPGVPLLVETMAGAGVELIVGLTDDRQFGPCLMIGMGGILTEVF
jgi:acyl-CoA synthetase (NDP forming)